jgi:hypothetical protein
VKFWNIDLTTEDGAMGAAQLGSYACFVAAALGLWSMVMVWGLIQAGAYMPLVAGFMLAEILLFAGTGLRMRIGKGGVIGIFAALMLVLELVAKLLAFSIPGLIINAILLVVTINGIRGAWAIRKGIPDAEEDAAIFS